MSIIDPALGGSSGWHRMTSYDRAGSRGYVQFSKYTHTHTPGETVVETKESGGGSFSIKCSQVQYQIRAFSIPISTQQGRGFDFNNF